MGEFIHNVQVRIKESSNSLLVFGFRALTGVFVGFTIALIGQEISSYGQLSFWLVLIFSLGVFLKVSKGWTALGVVVFNLIYVLLGLLLKMYIVVAPGA